MALLLLVAGCGEQGEGDRCDPRNANDDCESSLICTPLSSLRSGAVGAVCCPPNPTLNICRSSDFNINDDIESNSSGATSTPLDAGLADAGLGVDGGFDAAVDTSELMSIETSEPTTMSMGAASSAPTIDASSADTGSSDATSSSSSPTADETSVSTSASTLSDAGPGGGD